MLRRLTVRGFKPLREVTVELPRLALLFGPNAAGKSNFLEAVQTLSWLGNACTLQDTLGAPYPVRRLPFEAFSLDSDGFATKAPAPEQRLDLPRNLGNARFAALRAAVPTGGLYPSDFVFWALRCERHRRAVLHQPVSRSAGSNQPEARVSNTYAGLCLDGSWP